MLDLYSRVIDLRFTLGFDAPQSHPYPGVEIAVRVAAMRPGSREVVRGPADKAVQFLDHLGVQIMAALGNLAYFGFEVLQRLGPHLHRTRLDAKSQEVEPPGTL